MSENFLITGGAGYLGSVLTRHLLERGDNVTCLDNLMYRQESPLLFCHHPNYEFVHGDVRNEKTVEKALKGKDTVIPLAAIVGMPACDKNPHDAATINRDAVLIVDKLRSPNQKLIFPTTNSGYGTKTGDFHCDEETALEPVSFYGNTKVEAERELLASDKPVVTLRLATVFGVSPRMRMDLLVNDFVWQAKTTSALVLYKKDATRNYIHIDDVARAFIHSNENFESMAGRPYNVGLEDANLTKEQLALKIKEHFPDLVITNKEIGFDPDKRDYMVSNKRILETGFSPEHTLDDGIRQLNMAYDILLKVDKFRNA